MSTISYWLQPSSALWPGISRLLWCGPTGAMGPKTQKGRPWLLERLLTAPPPIFPSPHDNLQASKSHKCVNAFIFQKLFILFNRHLLPPHPLFLDCLDRHKAN